MPHNIKSCSGCKKNEINGCSTRRLEIFAAYTALKGGPPPKVTFVAAGGKKPPETPHDLEGLTLEQMSQKMQKLLDDKGKVSGPKKHRAARLIAAPALVPQFSGAMA